MYTREEIKKWIEKLDELRSKEKTMDGKLRLTEIMNALLTLIKEG